MGDRETLQCSFVVPSRQRQRRHTGRRGPEERVRWRSSAFFSRVENLDPNSSDIAKPARIDASANRWPSCAGTPAGWWLIVAARVGAATALVSGRATKICTGDTQTMRRKYILPLQAFPRPVGDGGQYRAMRSKLVEISLSFHQEALPSPFS